MKPGYLLVLLGGVIVPVILLVLLALDALRNQEHALRRRMDRQALLTLELIADDADRLLQRELAAVNTELEPLVQRNVPLEQLTAHGIRLAAARPLAENLCIFMNPWGFILPESTYDNDITEAVRRVLASDPGSATYKINAGKHAILLASVPGRPGLFTGYKINKTALVQELQTMLPAWQGMGFALSISKAVEDPAYSDDINISEEWQTEKIAERGDYQRPAFATPPILTRALPWPLENFELRATAEDSPEILNTRAQQQRLRFWTLLLLPLLLFGGIFIVIFAAVRDASRARDHSTLLAGISHDLRTPLAAAVMMAESLDSESMTDAASRKKCIQLLIRECNRLSNMVERVLSVVRMGNPAGIRNMTRIDLMQLVRRISGNETDKRTAAGVSTVTLSVDARVGETIPVTGNAGMLEQVLLNLIENARLYGNGKVQVELATETQGGILWEKRYAVIRVIDQGPGIAGDELNAIWKPFYRGTIGKKKNLSGTGLGLSLSRRMIKWHGGKISAVSKSGKGSIFTIKLPLAAQSEM